MRCTRAIEDALHGEKTKRTTYRTAGIWVAPLDEALESHEDTHKEETRAMTREPKKKTQAAKGAWVLHGAALTSSPAPPGVGVFPSLMALRICDAFHLQ